MGIIVVVGTGPEVGTGLVEGIDLAVAVVDIDLAVAVVDTVLVVIEDIVKGIVQVAVVGIIEDIVLVVAFLVGFVKQQLEAIVGRQRLFVARMMSAS